MAVKKKKADFNNILKNSAMAFGGGVAAEFVSDLIAQNAPEIVQKNPQITELAPAAIGVGLQYFMPGQMDALACGMIGASGAGMSDTLLGGMQGFNRIMQGNDAEEYARGQQHIEELIREGFEEPLNGEDYSDFEEIDEEEY